MNCSRRDLALLLPALATAQQASKPPAGALPSQAFPLNQLTGAQSGTIKLYQILTGDTHSGYRLDLHESELPPGEVPHAPHRHLHEELVLVWEGQLEVTISGRKTLLSPGSCAYFASNDLHGYRNPGPAAARYFVLALGQD